MVVPIKVEQIQRPAMSVLVFRVVRVSPLGLRTLILLPCRTLVNHFVDVCIHAGPEDSTSRAQFTLFSSLVSSMDLLQYILLHASRYDNSFNLQQLVRAELYKCHLYVKVDRLMSIAW